jgi:hypothetical protein
LKSPSAWKSKKLNGAEVMELLRSSPHDLCEAGFALGIPFTLVSGDERHVRVRCAYTTAERLAHARSPKRAFGRLELIERDPSTDTSPALSGAPAVFIPS